MIPSVCNGESSSSDDEYYNNFSKYKAKAALALRRNDCKSGKEITKNGKSTMKKVSSEPSDVEVLTSCPLSEQLISRAELDPEICLVQIADTSVNPVVDHLVTETYSTTECASPLRANPSFLTNVCRISISSKGQQKIFFCDLNEPLLNVIEEFAERTNVDPKRVNLYTKQYKRCDPKDTPRTLGLSEKCDEIELDAFEDLEENEGKRIALKYQTKGQRPTIIRVLPNATFASLKELFCTDHGLEPAKTRFLLGSIEMIADDETPNSLGLEDGDFRLLEMSNVRVPSLPFSFYLEKCSHCLIGLYIHRCLSFSHSTSNNRHNDVAAHKNHYQTLGVSRDASAKDIKTAFFELTKKHHPDMNPKDKTKAAEAFQNITDAYEVLGSEEKRQIYDTLTAPKPQAHFGRTPNFRRTRSNHINMGPAGGHKDWTDLDIDFRDFEHFQRENRRRQTFKDWARANTKSEFYWSSHQSSKSYKSPLALERENLEKKMHDEVMERRRRSATIPMFDELQRDKQKREQEERKKRMKNYIIFLPIALVILIFIADRR
ncbi:hypothetical protein niasHT_039756 [Heterodera trifolii]|uniref:J domain-containing protein n=1 Tax=Heterodera trifolii TaxID=157864 RepID=A0ABD2IMH3_9BILA